MIRPWLSHLALAATLGTFVWIGLRARAARDNVDDFVVARSSQGAATLGASFLASGMGAWILFAPPEVGAGVGMVAVAGYALGAAAPILAFALLGPRLRRIVPHGHSLTGFVRHRFGTPFHAYVVGISILYMLVFVTAELTAVGAVTAIISGADGRVAIMAVAAATLIYTAYGGLRASLRTDRWQAGLLLGLLAIAAIAVLVDLPGRPPGPGASDLLTIDRLGLEVALTLVIAVTAANLFHQGYWQRVWAARDVPSLRRGAGLGMAATVPVVAVVGALGILAVAAGFDVGAPPVPFFALLAGLPDWVGVVVVVLGISLVASSVDTLENGLAALVVAERPALSLAGARVVTVILMVPAAAVAFQGYSVLRLFLIADLLCAATAVPALLGLWARATSAAALAGGVAGLAGAVLPATVAHTSLVEGVRQATFPGAIPTLGPFLGAVLASTVVAVVVSLAGRQSEDLAAVGVRVPALSGSGTPTP